MRVAVGGIYHESNTFFSQSMTMERFAENRLDYGADVDLQWRNTASEMGGFFAGAEKFGFEVVPTIMAWGMPSGTVTADAFETLCREIVTRIRAAGKLDGVLLSLHGAMVSEPYDDADGEILRRVRKAIGDRVPLAVTLDFHANVTKEMVSWPDILLGYDTYPHVDQVERGLEAATLLYRMMAEGWKPHTALARRPLLAHILSQCTERAPMQEVLEAAHALEGRDGIRCVSVFAGFPYTDVSEAGFSVVTVADSDEAATSAAEELAETVWTHRERFASQIPQPEDAVREAMAQPRGLTVLADVGDNLGAGTPGDGTVLLHELIKQGAEGALVLLCDPAAVSECIAAGVGHSLSVAVGAKCDRHHGTPVTINGTVRLLSDGVYRNVGPMRDGVWENQGRTAIVDTGKILVVLTERRMPMWNLQQLRSLGIEPTSLRIIVVKSAIAYRAAYVPIADRIIEVDTPGLAAADVRRFTYRKLRRPVYPLDPL
jgi:microcystin degradation protein MlrC